MSKPTIIKNSVVSCREVYIQPNNLPNPYTGIYCVQNFGEINKNKHVYVYEHFIMAHTDAFNVNNRCIQIEKNTTFKLSELRPKCFNHLSK